VFTRCFPHRCREVREGCQEVLGHLLQAPRGQGFTPDRASYLYFLKLAKA
jgi:hypothetical protein